VAVLPKIYAKCIDDQDHVARRRIEGGAIPAMRQPLWQDETAWSSASTSDPPKRIIFKNAFALTALDDRCTIECAIHPGRRLQKVGRAREASGGCGAITGDDDRDPGEPQPSLLRICT